MQNPAAVVRKLTGAMVSELRESSIKSTNHPVMIVSPSKYKYSYGRYACIVGIPTGVAATSTVRV